MNKDCRSSREKSTEKKGAVPVFFTDFLAVGQNNAAELYLKPGDTIEIAYEGIATLRTHIVAP